MSDKFKWMKERLKESRRNIATRLQSPNGTVFEISVNNGGVLKTKIASKGAAQEFVLSRLR